MCVHVCVCVCVCVCGVLVAQSCLTLCDSIDCSSLGASVPGILQGRIPQWFAIPFSRGSSGPRDQTQVSHIMGRAFTMRAIREAAESPRYLLFSKGSLYPAPVNVGSL